MRLTCHHTTRYEYTHPVSFGPHLLYLRPRENDRQKLLSYSCQVNVATAFYPCQDPYDNSLTWAYFSSVAQTLQLDTFCEVETTNDAFQFVISGYARSFPFVYEPVVLRVLAPYLKGGAAGAAPAVQSWIQRYADLRESQETLELISRLTLAVCRSVRYRRRDMGASRNGTATLAAQEGSCRDLAVLLAEVLRAHGLAARFVSGYFYAPPTGSGPFSGTMHAWTETYLPGAGWIGFDPTHGQACDERYIAVAHSADADFVNPVQGSFVGQVTAPPELWVLVQIEASAPVGVR